MRSHVSTQSVVLLFIFVVPIVRQTLASTSADRIVIPIACTSTDILNLEMFERSTDSGGGEFEPSSKRHVEENRRPAVTDILNNWRRKFPASNMHYTSYDDNLELASSTVFSSCQAKSSITLDDSRYKFASGLYGAMSLDSDIVKELRRLTEQGVRGKHFSQMIFWSMYQVGCSVSTQQCVYVGSNGTKVRYVRLYACIFAYRSPPSMGSAALYAKSGMNCSMCYSDDFWCDNGLCRGYSVSSSSSPHQPIGVDSARPVNQHFDWLRMIIIASVPISAVVLLACFLRWRLTHGRRSSRWSRVEKHGIDGSTDESGRDQLESLEYIIQFNHNRPF